MSDRPSFTCPDCGTVTILPGDVENEYCPRCKTFPEQRREIAELNEFVRAMATPEGARVDGPECGV